MKLIFYLLIFILFSCQSNLKKGSDDFKKEVSKTTRLSLIDSLKNICRINILTTFDIQNLFTNDFSKMVPVSDSLAKKMFPEDYEFDINNLYIKSYIPNSQDYLTLILYQKNFEGENYRVDYITLVNLDSTGKVIDNIILTVEDNGAILYEVTSYFLGKDSIKTIEKTSSESYFNPDHDTLYTTEVYLLNNKIKIDTISLKVESEVNFY
jgi:hypothetical protein